MKQYLFNMVACPPLPLQTLLSRYTYVVYDGIEVWRKIAVAAKLGRNKEM